MRGTDRLDGVAAGLARQLQVTETEGVQGSGRATLQSGVSRCPGGGRGGAVQGCSRRRSHTVLLEHPGGARATVPRNLSCGLHTQGPISGTHKGTNARGMPCRFP